MSRIEVRPVTFQQLGRLRSPVPGAGRAPLLLVHALPLPRRAPDERGGEAGLHASAGDSRTPIGVLAYRDDEVVGWCSTAPRETYVKLERSRTMPRVTPAETSTWTVLCFFVPPGASSPGNHPGFAKGRVAYARRAGCSGRRGLTPSIPQASAPPTGGTPRCLWPLASARTEPVVAPPRTQGALKCKT